MTAAILLGLVVIVHRLLLLDVDHVERRPMRIICPTCQRAVAIQVYHWHMESHTRGDVQIERS